MLILIHTHTVNLSPRCGDGENRLDQDYEEECVGMFALEPHHLTIFASRSKSLEKQYISEC